MKGTAIHAVGRRKTSVARAYIKPGSGAFIVNKKPFEQYFGRESFRIMVRSPMVVVEQSDKWDIYINVDGGGLSGQAGATRHAISRCLIKADIGLRPALKAEGFLTRDPRAVERKKYGRHKARKRPQYSKR